MTAFILLSGPFNGRLWHGVSSRLRELAEHADEAFRMLDPLSPGERCRVLDASSGRARRWPKVSRCSPQGPTFRSSA